MSYLRKDSSNSLARPVGKKKKKPTKPKKPTKDPKDTPKPWRHV